MKSNNAIKYIIKKLWDKLDIPERQILIDNDLKIYGYGVDLDEDEYYSDVIIDCLSDKYNGKLIDHIKNNQDSITFEEIVHLYKDEHYAVDEGVI